MKQVTNTTIYWTICFWGAMIMGTLDQSNGHTFMATLWWIVTIPYAIMAIINIL